MAIQVEAARNLVYRAAEAVDDGVTGNELATVTAIAKCHARKTVFNQPKWGVSFSAGFLHREAKINRTLLAAVVAGVLGLAIGWYGGADLGFAYATISLSCGGKTYTLSTGNSKGNCQNNGTLSLGTDGGGNEARASCEAGRQSSSGSGSCTAK